MSELPESFSVKLALNLLKDNHKKTNDGFSRHLISVICDAKENTVSEWATRGRQPALNTGLVFIKKVARVGLTTSQFQECVEAGR